MEDIGAVVFCQWCFAPLRGYAIDKSQQLRFRVYRKRWYLANVKLDMFISILYVTWIRETRRKITCSFCTVLFWDLTYNRRIIVYHTLKIRISRWEGYRISSPIGWRNSRVISLENPNSNWTIPHNSAISRGIYEQRKDEIENGFLLSFTDSGTAFPAYVVDILRSISWIPFAVI